jgi:hypothetical protein
MAVAPRTCLETSRHFCHELNLSVAVTGEGAHLQE